MPMIAWNDRLSVHVPTIDNEHRELIDILNQLYDAIRAGAARPILSKVLDRLTDYTQFHFTHEESLFTQSDYPDIEPHRLEHANAAAWLNEIRRKYDEGVSAGLSLDVVTYLKDWLFDHILGSDRQYIPYLQAAGIASPFLRR